MQGGGATCRGGGAGRCIMHAPQHQGIHRWLRVDGRLGWYLDDDVELHEDQISDGLNTDGSERAEKKLAL